MRLANYFSNMGIVIKKELSYLLESLTLIRLGFLKVVFYGVVNMTHPLIFQEEVISSNINITLYNC